MEAKTYSRLAAAIFGLYRPLAACTRSDRLGNHHQRNTAAGLAELDCWWRRARARLGGLQHLSHLMAPMRSRTAHATGGLGTTMAHGS